MSVADEMAQLFDLDNGVVDSENYGEEAEDKSQTFEQKAKDLQLIIEKEPEIKEEETIEEVKTTEDIIKKSIPQKNESEVVKSEVQEPDQNGEEEMEEDGPDILAEAEEDETFMVNPENPLGFFGNDLKNYNELIQNSKGMFELFDGNILMKPFYVYKAKELGYLLKKFSILDCDAIQNELTNIRSSNSIKGLPSAPEISEKMNSIIQQRERLSEIMIQLHKQYHVWEQSMEMLKGKLWIVKDLKGQHKREGVVADHMGDVVHYVIELRSLLDAGKYIDNLLISSQESLSRQLSCVQDKNSYEYKEFSNEFDNSRKKMKNITVEDINTDSDDEFGTIG